MAFTPLGSMRVCAQVTPTTSVMAATNSVARRCNFARRRKSGRDAFIVGSSREIAAAAEDPPPTLAAGVRPPQRPGVVAWLRLPAGAAMRKDEATVRGCGRWRRQTVKAPCGAGGDQ